MLFYFACEAAGASAPGIPHALLMERRKDQCTTRAHSRRENAEVCVALRRMPIDVVIASAAKQSSFLLSLTMDCFAALAMHYHERHVVCVPASAGTTLMLSP